MKTKLRPWDYKQDDAAEAFVQAIKQGRLSANPSSTNYAGLFMYMGAKNGVDLFKHVDTRRYLP